MSFQSRGEARGQWWLLKYSFKFVIVVWENFSLYEVFRHAKLGQRRQERWQVDRLVKMRQAAKLIIVCKAGSIFWCVEKIVQTRNVSPRWTEANTRITKGKEKKIRWTEANTRITLEKNKNKLTNCWWWERQQSSSLGHQARYFDAWREFHCHEIFLHTRMMQRQELRNDRLTNCRG